jgi:hypothetical protein
MTSLPVTDFDVVKDEKSGGYPRHPGVTKGSNR